MSDRSITTTEEEEEEAHHCHQPVCFTLKLLLHSLQLQQDGGNVLHEDREEKSQRKEGH